jgi:hypothetical protein
LTPSSALLLFIIPISDLLDIPAELTLVRQLPSGSLAGCNSLEKSLRKRRLCASGEVVMAKVISFYVPRRFRKIPRKVQQEPGKVIEFGSPSTKAVPAQPHGGVIQWPLEATEFTAVGESFSHVGFGEGEP